MVPFYGKWCHSIYLNDRQFVTYKFFFGDLGLTNWIADDILIGAILYISMISNLLHINYSLWVFGLDKLDYGCYIILTRCCG